MSLSWILLEIMLNAYEAAFFTSIISVRGKLKGWVRTKHILLFACALTVAFCVVNFSTNFNFISMYIFPLLILPYPLLFTQGRIPDRLFWYFTSIVALSSCDLLAISCVVYFIPTPLEAFSQPNSYRLFIIVMAKSLHSAAWYFLIKYDFRGIVVEEPARRFAMKVLFICFITWLLSVLCCSTYTNDAAFVLKEVVMNLTMLCGMAYILLNQIMESKKELQRAHNEEFIKVYRMFKDFRHSTIQQLQYTWQYAPHGPNNTQLKEYLSFTEQINRQLQLDFNTGDELVDNLLATKEAIAFQHKVKLQISAAISGDHTIPSEDLCIILDNLLDNGIAYLAQQEMERLLNLYLMTDENHLTIYLEHPTEGEKNFDMGNYFLDDEADNSELKLVIVKDLVDQYKGTMTTEHEAYYFSLEIRFIAQEQEQEQDNRAFIN